MAAHSFINASTAAAIGGVSVEALGCEHGYEFPTKGGLISSGGAFDQSRLEDYDDEYFVLEKDVVLGTSLVSLQMDSGVESRGNVQVDDGIIAPSVAVLCTQGQTITIKCILPDASDLFLGWYSGSTPVSSDKNYSFTVNGAVTLTAKVAYMDLSVSSLEFSQQASSKQVSISSNVDWSLT